MFLLSKVNVILKKKGIIRFHKSAYGDDVKVSGVTIKSCSDHSESQLKV